MTENRHEKRRITDECEQGTEIQQSIESKLIAIQEQLTALTGAFVDSDLVGHRNAHQSLIDAKKAESDFWSEMKLDLAKKGLWGLLTIVVGFTILGIMTKFGIGKTP